MRKYIKCETCGKPIFLNQKAYKIGDFISCKKCLKTYIKIEYPKYSVDECLADNNYLTIYSKR